MLSETPPTPPPPVLSVCACANPQLSNVELGICYVKMRMNSIVSEEKQMDVRHLFPSVPRTELPGALCFSPVAGRELSELL